MAGDCRSQSIGRRSLAADSTVGRVGSWVGFTVTGRPKAAVAGPLRLNRRMRPRLCKNSTSRLDRSTFFCCCPLSLRDFPFLWFPWANAAIYSTESLRSDVFTQPAPIADVQRRKPPFRQWQRKGNAIHNPIPAHLPGAGSMAVPVTPGRKRAVAAAAALPARDSSADPQ